MIRVVATGEAIQPDKELLGREVRQSVRYADPAAWVVATAIARALKAAPGPHEAETASVIVVSETGPQETMNSVAQAALEGYSSPMRYPASNPGSLAGVSCIAFGLRGGALNLTMPPSAGVETALRIAGGWLEAGVASMAVIAVCAASGNFSPYARSIIIVADSQAGVPLASDHAAWLCESPDQQNDSDNQVKTG